MSRAHVFPRGATKVSRRDLLDEVGSIDVGKVEWTYDAMSYRAEINGSHIEAKSIALMAWAGLVNGREAVGRADNAPDVMASLLEKVTEGR